ncbi:uncharacterized protein LOC131023228 [Salvia miltiorrhiza]|uniref:uncharacterized protein LOC131023228 n=1 Tax=Salvia miltiorrhiza TaxID=226208 RepID=UPI0025ACFA10|nr:uncharacterized protein LOC131023228 [Salvia miltiorrhiza]
MRRALFLRIVNAVASDPYFQQRTDGLGRPGFTPLQKCTVVVRMLANGGAADQYNEYLQIAESTSLECLRRFCRAIIHLFGAEYLRRPTSTDCQRLLAMHEAKHGFPGMLGSLDCMHWPWKNCPTAIRENRPSSSKPSHRKIYGSGMLFLGLLPVFVKSPTHPTDPKGKRFKVMQKAALKDIERAFGVLQAHWAIVKGPSRLWSKEEMSDIMFTCIILHNMIIEDEGEHATQWEEDIDEASSSAASQPRAGAPSDFRAFLARQASMRDAKMHARLTLDLKEHIWSKNDDSKYIVVSDEPR